MGNVQELPANHRSTSRIIELANRWSNTIADTAGMANPAMEHRRDARTDVSDHHVAQIHFDSRENESAWIGDTIANLVKTASGVSSGAFHDEGGGARGLTLSDIAVLVRSGHRHPHLPGRTAGTGHSRRCARGGRIFSPNRRSCSFWALWVSAQIWRNFGGTRITHKSMPGRVRAILDVKPIASQIIPAALLELRRRGLNVPKGTRSRLEMLRRAIKHRLESAAPQPESISGLKCGSDCRRWLERNHRPRRIFPQTIFHWLLREAGIHRWRTVENLATAESTLFHVGQLSSLVKAIETSGWTSAEA